VIPSFKLKYGASPGGQGLVEFALIIPILLILMAGIADFGLLYLTSQTVKHATREGARFAVKLSDLAVNDPRVSEYVETFIPAGDQYSTFTTVTTAFPGCATNDQVTVTVSGSYSWLALSMIGLPDVPLNLSTSMRYELCEDG
jgi:Flp pilus assembly protein TadG